MRLFLNCLFSSLLPSTGDSLLFFFRPAAPLAVVPRKKKGDRNSVLHPLDLTCVYSVMYIRRNRASDVQCCCATRQVLSAFLI
mmetsp:Transcript_13629/g.27097  ORF Transcript_13629/g.27097 Transcript_13629/m.27097 type:complete len:83 (+) Transcript_13629:345-593(+)